MQNIYTWLVNHLTLSPAHHEALIVQRGLSDATIRDARFVSAGPPVAALEPELAAAFAEADLVAAGVFIHDGRAARLNPMLLEDHVLIPYLDLDGAVYFLRPHRWGFRGVPSEIYHRRALAGDPAEVVLTEGEFKAAAGVQYGLPTIAVPGISSFSETKFPELVQLLNAHKVRRLIILFDNETKDDPAFPQRYKEQPHDRYDTPFYAYYMATRLEREGKEVAIATFPEGWKVDGKVDLDGAAAQGKTAGELRKLCYDAKPRTAYLHDLTAEAKQVVLRKSAQKRHRSTVRKEFNRYVVTRTRGKTTWEETISNFVIRIVATHATSEGMRREVEFVNEFGKRSEPCTLDPAEMGAPDAFRTFCFGRGDFVWRGTIEDLLTIWESEFLLMDEGRFIVESDHVGWVEREAVWLFGNVAIRADGTILRPDRTGIFWMEKRGIKPIPLSVTTGRATIAEGIPSLALTQAPDMAEVRTRLGEAVGPNEARVLLGWASAVAFMEEVFAAYRSFPFLFITGRWQSGKSTVAEWIQALFGIEQAAKSISQTTPVAIQRSLAYYSCLPVYLDEYRNTKDILYKNGFLRNVYNRQGAGKGTQEMHGLREAKVRGTLIIAGEETPKDGGLMSRCICVFISRAKRVVNHLAWFNAHRTRLSGHFYGLLTRKPALARVFAEALEAWRAHFTSQGIDDRMAINYATVVAGYVATYGADDLAFADWLAGETKAVQAEYGEEQAVAIFLDDLLALRTRELIDDRYWRVADGRVHLYFHGLHQVWSEQFRKSRGEEAFKEASIRAYLREEPGFVAVNVPHRIRGGLVKCIVFDLAAAPPEIRHLVEPADASVPQ